MSDVPEDRRSTDSAPLSKLGAGEGGGETGSDEEYLDEQESESFPASDPHSDWSGPRP